VYFAGGVRRKRELRWLKGIRGLDCHASLAMTYSFARDTLNVAHVSGMPCKVARHCEERKARRSNPFYNSLYCLYKIHKHPKDTPLRAIVIQKKAKTCPQ
jgi:hypothetical protein